MNVNVVI